MSGFKRRDPADLSSKLAELKGGTSSFEDPAEWKLSVDKLGNGSAVIRFLPAKEDNGTPFVKVFSHGFKHNGRWYVENCPTTIGRDHCPVCAANKELWESEIKANQDIVRLRKRKLSYWANIVVLKDEASPENQGKVFKYRFGQKIMDKIVAAAAADEDLGTSGMDVTCAFSGANFLLKAKKVGEHQNYDDSKFGAPSELFGGNEEELSRVWNDMHKLESLIAESNFKPERELKENFRKVVGAVAPTRSAVDDAQLENEPATQNARATAPAAASVSKSDDELDALLADLDLS